MTAYEGPGRDRRSAEAGYTFVELLVSMVLLTVAIGAMFTLAAQTQAEYDAQQDTMGLRQQARIALDEMATQLRMAGAAIDNLPEPLVQASANTIVFVADIDAGGAGEPCDLAIETALNGGAERLTFSVANGQLTRGIDCWDGNNWSVEYAPQVLARDLVGGAPTFRYFDTNGAEILPGVGGNLSAAQRAAVRVVSLSLSLQDAEQHIIMEGMVDANLFTMVKLRNVLD